MTEANLPPVGVLALFRNNPNFRRLYWARLSSLFGDWFNLLALLALLRSMGANGAGEFGWILILKTLPNVFVVPFAGVLADRFSRRKMMLASNTVCAGLVVMMLGLGWYPSVFGLYTLVILQSAVSACFEPARNAIVPDIVKPEELTAANALTAATWSAMLTLGSAMGGLFTAWFGWQIALCVDAASYLIANWFLWRMMEPTWERRVVTDSSWLALLGVRDILEGIHYVSQRPRVWTLMLVKSGWCLAGGIALVLTLLGEQVFPVAGTALLGVTVLYVARGIGTGMGPFLSRWLSRSEPEAMERLILYGYLCGALFYFCLPWARVLWLAALFVLCAHWGGATIWVFSTVRLQQIVPTHVRGRVFSTQQAAFTVMIGMTTWLYGWLLDHKVASLQTLVYGLAGSLFGAALLWGIRGLCLGWAKEDPDAMAFEEGRSSM